MSLVFPLVGTHRFKKPLFDPQNLLLEQWRCCLGERGSLKPSLLPSISTSALPVFLLDTGQQAGTPLSPAPLIFLPFTPEFLLFQAFGKAFWHAHPKCPPPNPLLDFFLIPQPRVEGSALPLFLLLGGGKFSSGCKIRAPAHPGAGR